MTARHGFLKGALSGSLTALVSSKVPTSAFRAVQRRAPIGEGKWSWTGCSVEDLRRGAYYRVMDR